jgi:hypothetical protein
VDWALFEQLVRHHRIAPLAHRGLVGLGAPPATVESIERLARCAAVQTLAQLRLVSELVGELADAGIDVVVLKGLPLAQLAYADPALREPGDIDLLVDPRQVDSATKLLLGRGMVVRTWPNGPAPELVLPILSRSAELPALNEISFVGDGTRVDLHWRLFENSALCPVPAQWLASPAVVAVGPASLPVLPTDQLWPYLAVHGTKHNWRRLKWLADVPALVGAGLAGEVGPGAARSTATGLLVAEAVFGPFLPGARHARTVAVRGTGVLVRRSLAALSSQVDPDESVGPRHVAAHARARLALRADLSYRGTEARNWLIRAGRAQLVPTPPVGVLLAAPSQWATRHLSRRRTRRGAQTAAAGPVARPAGLGWRAGGPIEWQLLDHSWGRHLLRHAAQAYRQVDRVTAVARLGAGRRTLLLEAVAELARSSIELALLPSDRIVPRLGRQAGPTEPPADQSESRAAARVGAAVASAARRLPWHPTCLRQAVAATRMLHRRGIHSRIHLGVATEPDVLSAHAWVTVGGGVVLGGRGVNRFTPVAAFTPQPARLPE